MSSPQACPDMGLFSTVPAFASKSILAFLRLLSESIAAPLSVPCENDKAPSEKPAFSQITPDRGASTPPVMFLIATKSRDMIDVH